MDSMDDKSATDVQIELEKSKKKRKEVTESLKKWATGEDKIYDENGKRIGGEPLVSYDDYSAEDNKEKNKEK